MNYKVQNLSQAKWQENGNTTAFSRSSKCFGIINEEGQAVSFNGECPSAWKTKKIAQFILDTTQMYELALINISN